MWSSIIYCKSLPPRGQGEAGEVFIVARCLSLSLVCIGSHAERHLRAVFLPTVAPVCARVSIVIEFCASESAGAAQMNAGLLLSNASPEGCNGKVLVHPACPLFFLSFFPLLVHAKKRIWALCDDLSVCVICKGCVSHSRT